jgi:phosphoglycolate phosphatase-like HAD superfamily hydrolase
MTQSCYVFDIDGTIADCSHRIHLIQTLPKDWRSFFAACHLDKPIPHVIELARSLSSRRHIVYVSGRSDECRQQTEAWLKDHRLPEGVLYMRKAGDHRDDDIIKLELLADLRADGFEPVMAFDDRTRVVNAWRSAGIPCAQVAPGDF